jgi:hypothetical protein
LQVGCFVPQVCVGSTELFASGVVPASAGGGGVVSPLLPPPLVLSPLLPDEPDELDGELPPSEVPLAPSKRASKSLTHAARMTAQATKLAARFIPIE